MRSPWTCISSHRGKETAVRTIRITPLAGAFLALLPLGASAQDLPREAKFSITYTGVNPSPLKPLSYGKDRDVIMGQMLMTAVNDAGGGLLHNMTGRCLLVTLIDRAEKTQQVHGYC